MSVCLEKISHGCSKYGCTISLLLIILLGAQLFFFPCNMEIWRQKTIIMSTGKCCFVATFTDMPSDSSIWGTQLVEFYLEFHTYLTSTSTFPNLLSVSPFPFSLSLGLSLILSLSLHLSCGYNSVLLCCTGRSWTCLQSSLSASFRINMCIERYRDFF